MLFYGPPGTGKTSTILALAEQLYGPDLMKSRVLELNASDERGIAIIREKVKNFARTTISKPSQRDLENYPCPPYKIIILDEADSMTNDAQSALRRTMETYSKITRFCLICNYVTRIIDPVASRCSKFRFKPLDESNALDRLTHIAKSEGVSYADDALPALLQTSGGDLRKAITLLQSAAKICGHTATAHDDEGDEMEVEAKQVTVSIVNEISGYVPDEEVQSLVAACRPETTSADFGLIFKQVRQRVDNLVYEGYSVGQLIVQLHEKLLTDDFLSAEQKNKISWILSDVDKRLNDGSDEHIILLDLSTKIAGIAAN
jgi:replication factor C subunit 2/4